MGIRWGLLVACLAAAGCKKEATVVAVDGTVAAPASFDAAAVSFDAAAASFDAAAASFDASAVVADAAAVAADAAAVVADAAAASFDAAAAAAAADAGAVRSEAPAGGPWHEIAAAAVTAVREGKADALASRLAPFRAARAACDDLYPDTAKKRDEWKQRTARQLEEIEAALRDCRDLTSWKDGTPAPATWSEPSPVEACDDLAESDLRVVVDPGGEAGEAGTRHVITVHVVVMNEQPYPTALSCAIRQTK
jgi:hypothetical protein